MKRKKYDLSFRIYFMVVAILTMCFALVVSYGILLLFVHLLYGGEVTPGFITIICLAGCGLTVLIGGSMLWFGAGHLTRPLERLNRGVKRVAEGDFSVRVTRNRRCNTRKTANQRYKNEIDELTVNFNRMAAALQGMDEMQKDFLSNVSHEVKTPVAAITGFTEMLLEVELTEEERRDYLKLTHQESLRLSRLCESMLRMSRLDNQEIVTRKELIRLDEQIRKCIIMLSEKWADKEMGYELQLQPVIMESDGDMLQQVWMNLIDNAIKYSKENSIIQIRTILQEGVVIIEIQDYGEGIPKDKLEKIFDKFYQCDESHKKQGSGLGLCIVRRIMELLGGTITCQSKEGYGTLMTVTLPDTN